MAILGGGERDLTIKLLANVDDFKKNMNKAEDQTKTFGDKVGSALKGVGVAVGAAAAAAGAFAVKYGIDAVKAASNLQETVSKVGVIFGDSAGQVQKFAETAAATLGQSQQQALDASATFAVFGKSAGLAGEDLVKFSTDFTTLAADLASFNNTTPEQAIQAIGSALRGEAEPLRAYGVLLNDATLKQAALELGLISTTKNALTPQQKVLAAQKVIYEQTTDAQGDFARTSDGLANQTRILQARLEDVRTEIGSALLPIVTELATFFGDEVIPIIERFGNYFNDEMIPDIRANVIPAFEDLIDTLGGLSTTFGDVNDAARETQFTFSDILFGNAGIVPSFTRATEFLVALGATIVDVLNRIRAFIQGDLDTALRDFDNRFRNNRDSINNVNTAMVNAYKQADFYRSRIQNEVTPQVDKNTKVLTDHVETLKKQTTELSKASETTKRYSDNTKSAADNVEILYNATKRATTANSAYKRSLDEVRRSFTDVEISAMFEGGAGSVVGGGGITTALSPLTEAMRRNLAIGGLNLGSLIDVGSGATAEFLEIVRQINDLGGGALGIGDIRKGFDLFKEANIEFSGLTDFLGQPWFRGITEAEKQQFVQEVNIYVQGALGDPEGTARAIQEVVSTSNARSGFQSLTPAFGLE